MISEIIKIKSFDGYSIKGKLTLPDGDKEVSKLVIYIDGAGPKTYHIEYFPEYYANNGIAFFSFNKRGVYEDENPSSIKEINNDEYKTYLPNNCIEDIFYIIKFLKSIERLKNCIILLNGWSEGTIIAPLFALKYPNMVNALILIGYSNINMKDLQKWQCSKIEGGKELFEKCFTAIECKDNEYLMNNMGIPYEWFLAHYNLTSNNEILPMLELPIHILNGESDGYCDINGVYEIKDKFYKLGKTNLYTYVFENHGHGLDINWKIYENNEFTTGIKKLFEIVKNIK
jgi:predicted esterase